MNPHTYPAATPEPVVAPDLLTLAEAAAVLRIGRTVVYELARRYEASGGHHDELVVVRVGRQFRVPRSWLETVTGGPLSWPPCEPASSTSFATATTKPGMPLPASKSTKPARSAKPRGPRRESSRRAGASVQLELLGD